MKRCVVIALAVGVGMLSVPRLVSADPVTIRSGTLASPHASGSTGPLSINTSRGGSFMLSQGVVSPSAAGFLESLDPTWSHGWGAGGFGNGHDDGWPRGRAHGLRALFGGGFGGGGLSARSFFVPGPSFGFSVPLGTPSAVPGFGAGSDVPFLFGGLLPGESILFTNTTLGTVHFLAFPGQVSALVNGLAQGGVTSTPEPGTMLLVALGLGAAARYRLRRRQ